MSGKKKNDMTLVQVVNGDEMELILHLNDDGEIVNTYRSSVGKFRYCDLIKWRDALVEREGWRKS